MNRAEERPWAMEVGGGGVTQPVAIARALAAALRAEGVEAIFRAAPARALNDCVAIAKLSRSLIVPHFLRRTGIHFVGKCSSPSSVIDDVRTRVGECFGTVARDTGFHRSGLLDVAQPAPNRLDGAVLKPGVLRIATLFEARMGVSRAVPDRPRSAR
ncbi:hypothetical protein [Methylobacterium sp. Gmos1]